MTGSVSFWTDIVLYGEIQIWVDGEYAGALDSYFGSGTPECAQDGTVASRLSLGLHSYRAKNPSGSTWSGTFTIEQGQCLLLRLTK
jgi:hypothetical protein